MTDDEIREQVGLLDEEERQDRANKDYERREIARETFESKRAAALWKPPAPHGIASYLADEPEEPSFHVQDMWPHGGTVVVEAPKKWGKSTLVRNTVTSVLTGSKFLDRFDVPSPFKRVLVIDMELTRRQFWDYWHGVDLTNEQMEVWRLRGSVGTMAIRDSWVRREMTKRLADSGADLVVLDPLGPALRVCGYEENSNTEVGIFLDTFDEMRADAGIEAAFIPHHMGHNGERARGASVFGDKADAIWTGTFLKAGDKTGPRFLSALGRDVELEATELMFNADQRSLSITAYSATRDTAQKMRKADEAEDRAEMVRAALRDNPDGFKSNDALSEYLKVKWNGTPFVRIRATLEAEGTLKATTRGWYPQSD